MTMRPSVAIVATLLLGGCLVARVVPGRSGTQRAAVLSLQMDPTVLRELQQGSLPIAREISLPLPDGKRATVRFDPIRQCDPVAGQRGLSARAGVDGEEWYVKVVSGAGAAHFLVLGDDEAWTYNVRDPDTGTLEARPLNAPPDACGVTSEAQGRQQALALAITDANWPRSWPASPRMFRFAVSATFGFMSRFRDTERVASMNVHFASAFLEKSQSVALCPIIDARAIERKHQTIYKGDNDQKRAAAHTLFRTLELRFDLGQVFDIDGNSWGEPDSVCDPANAGKSITKWGDESENVWLLVHEASHQLGASHTFNGNISGRNPASAVEPDDGVSVMGYPTDRSQPWFHPFSVGQLLTNVATVVGTKKPCGEKIGTVAASAPQLDDKRLVVPRSTAFELRAVGRGGATQFAIGEITRATAPKTSPPWFSTQPPSSDPLFKFPSRGERPPDRDGDLTFLAMGRDKDGSIGFAFHTVNVTSPPAARPRRERQR